MSAYAKLCQELEKAPQRWLVTGAAGFIGSALVEKLLSIGQTVVGLDNFVTGHRKNLDDAVTCAGDGAAERFRFIEGDICDLDACRKASDAVDVVLHQAALGSVPRSIDDPLASHRANVDGFLNVAIAARDAKAKRMVYASSSSIYGDHPALPKTEPNTGRALSPYAATKQINELYAGVLELTYQFEMIGLRYFNVFGRRQDPNGPYAAVIPRWVEHLIQGESCVIFGDGSQSRDFCYVDNAVQANILAANADASATGQAYNVGYGGRTDLNQLFAMLRERVVEFQPAAADAVAKHAEPRPGDVPHSQADISQLVKATGYAPTHDVSAGLTETVRWFGEHR